jgi:alkyl hydroperoxide reductase subunit AhpC
MASVGKSVDDFTVTSTLGDIDFTAWRDEYWSLVFAYKAKSPTCSTEIVELQRLNDAFAEQNIKLLGIAVESSQVIDEWLADLQAVCGCKPSFALASDQTLAAARALGFIDKDAAVPTLLRTASVISPQGRVVSQVTGSINNGRNFSELLRTVQALQLTAKAKVATPAQWQPGSEVMLPPSLSEDEAQRRYPGVVTLTPYLRMVPQPL